MGRKLLEQKSRIDPEQRYTPREALELLKELEGAKFDESVEAHVHLNVDPRRADQMVRGTLMLPNGTGKTRRVAVFAEGEKARAVEEIKRGKIEYRVDRYGIIHGVIGKKSFDLDSLVENYYVLREELQRARPAPVKGRYFKSVALTTTMGPSVKVDPAVERD